MFLTLPFEDVTIREIAAKARCSAATIYDAFESKEKLFEASIEEARARNLPEIELQARVELTENHAAFAAMGFREVGRTAHDGYNRPTSVTMRYTI